MKVNKHLVDIYRKDTIEKSKIQQAFIQWYDNYTVNPLLCYFTLQDIQYIYKLAISPAMHCAIMEKYRIIDELMESRGFKLIGGGTNRRAYECLYDNRVVAKVATDRGGLTSNLREYTNQNVMKPFCCKIFEVSPCGTIAIIEKIVPIKDVPEFQKYADEIFKVLYFKIRNNSIALEDIGTRSMKNWGYRSGFGPVLLDYPSMYVADPAKRFCKDIVNGCLCGGTLDYDEGFNVIVCSECGRTYFAQTIAKKDGDDISSLLDAVGYQKKNEGVKAMKVKIINAETHEVISERNIGGKSSYVEHTNSTYRQRNNSFVPKTVPTPVPKRKVKIISTGEIYNKSENPTPVVNENPNPQREVKIVSVSDTTISETTPISSDRRNQAIQEFNNALISTNGDNTPVVGQRMTDSEFIQKCQSLTVSHKYVEENEAWNLYRKVSIATMVGDECMIDDANLGHADTYVNRFLKKIMPNVDNMWDVFYMLVNKVRNTRDFFNTMVTLWYKLVECYCFDKDETVEYTTYCVYEELYEIYVNAIQRAIHDYSLNVVFGDKMTYNRKNGIAIFGNAYGQIAQEAEDDYEFYNNLGRTSYVTFTVGENFAEQLITDINPNTNVSEPVVNTVETEVVDAEVVEEVPATPVIPENIPDTKTMTRKQENRYNKKKKNRRKR